jgi:hypothetical protein
MAWHGSDAEQFRGGRPLGGDNHVRSLMSGAVVGCRTVVVHSHNPLSEQHRFNRETIGELLGDGSHSFRGECRVTCSEAAVDDVEHATRRGERRIELDAAEQWPEQAIDGDVTEPFDAQMLLGGHVRRPKEFHRWALGDAPAQFGHAQFVANSEDRGECRGK